MKLDIVGSSEIGRSYSFDISEASPFLNKGIGLEILSALGKIPVHNIWLIINATGLIM